METKLREEKREHLGNTKEAAMNEYLKNFFGDDVKTFTDTLYESKALLAGSSVIRGVLGEERAGFDADDLDIYINKNGAIHFKNTILSLGYKFVSINTLDPKYIQFAAEYDKSFFRKNHIGIRFRFESKKYFGKYIDVMIVDNDTKPIDVVTNFDLTFCEIWYDGKEINATDLQGVYEKKGKLRNEYRDALLKDFNHFIIRRIKKYTKRGFEVEINTNGSFFNTYTIFELENYVKRSPSDKWAMMSMYKEFVKLGENRFNLDEDEDNIDKYMNATYNTYCLTNPSENIVTMSETFNFDKPEAIIVRSMLQSDTMRSYSMMLDYRDRNPDDFPIYRKRRIALLKKLTKIDKYVSLLETYTGISRHLILFIYDTSPYLQYLQYPHSIIVDKILISYRFGLKEKATALPEVLENLLGYMEPSEIGYEGTTQLEYEDLDESKFSGTCTDFLSADMTEHKIKKYLSDNISFVFISDNKAVCLSNTVVQSYLDNKDGWFYECVGDIIPNSEGDKPANMFDDIKYVRLISGTGQNVFVSYNDLYKAITSGFKLFHLVRDRQITNSIAWKNAKNIEPDMVGSYHCQAGSILNIYNIKVCSGPNCKYTKSLIDVVDNFFKGINVASPMSASYFNKKYFNYLYDDKYMTDKEGKIIARKYHDKVNNKTLIIPKGNKNYIDIKIATNKKDINDYYYIFRKKLVFNSDRKFIGILNKEGQIINPQSYKIIVYVLNMGLPLSDYIKHYFNSSIYFR